MKDELILAFLYVLGYRTPVSVGYCYHYGIHVEQNRDKALIYYQQAAFLGDSAGYQGLSILHEATNPNLSLFYLGMMCELLAEWDKALEAYLKSAHNDHAESMYKIGLLYSKNRLSNNGLLLIEENIVNEISWYRKAIQNNSHEALKQLILLSNLSSQAAYMLGMMCELGEINNKQNMKQALKYYIKSSKMGYKPASFRLGEIYEFGYGSCKIHLSRAFTYYLLAADKKNSKIVVAFEKLIKQIDDDILRLKLIDVYQNIYNDFLLSIPHLKYLADYNNNEAISKIKNFIRDNPEFAFELAKLYENENSIKQACTYYAMAACQKHQVSFDKLQNFAKIGNVDAQYILGRDFYHKKNKIKDAINWCMLAAEQKHEEALQYLKITKFNSNYYEFIAQRYEHGDDVNQDIFLAIYFYEKAFEIGNKAHALKIGQLYEVQKNYQKAYDYYLNAAQQKNEASLILIEKIIEHLGNKDELWLQVADLYKTVFKKDSSALIIYKTLTDKNNSIAISKIDKLANENVQYAYELAEEYIKNQNSIEKACKYYALAITKNHQTSFAKLKLLAEAGNQYAQYHMGQYCHVNKRYVEAINWCLLAAEQSNVRALDYLQTTKFNGDSFLLIAEKYDNGDGVQRDLSSAIFYYSKSCNLGNKKATYRLGNIYRENFKTSRAKEDIDKACEYFIKAALKDSKKALIAVEELGEIASNNVQSKISNMYKNTKFNDEFKSNYWQQKSMEGNKEINNHFNYKRNSSTNLPFFKKKSQPILGTTLNLQKKKLV